MTIMTKRYPDVPFEKGIDIVKAAIKDQGFLLIHEINTKEILHRNGYTIRDLRQLLFFRPTYMMKLLDNRADDAILAPLKIVVREHEEGGTSLTAVDPMSMVDHDETYRSLAVELKEKVELIVGSPGKIPA